MDQWSNVVGNPRLEACPAGCPSPWAPLAALGARVRMWAQVTGALLPRVGALLSLCHRGKWPSCCGGCRPASATQVLVNSVRLLHPPLLDEQFLLLGAVGEGETMQHASVRIVSHKWPYLKINKLGEKGVLDHLCLFLCVWLLHYQGWYFSFILAHGPRLHGALCMSSASFEGKRL